MGLPPPPTGSYTGYGLGEDDWTPTTGAEGGAAVEDATDAAFLERYDQLEKQRQLEEAQQEHQQRLLDMTQTPSELAAAAQTRSIDDSSKALVSSTESPPQELQRQRYAGEQGDGEGEEEKGAGLWASRGMLAGAAMLYGTNFGCVKLLEESVPMSLAAALRFSVALVPFIPFLKKVNPGVFRAGAEVSERAKPSKSDIFI